MVDNSAENRAELYYEKLKTTTNVGGTLAKFMCELIDREITKSYVMQVNRLIRIFGRFNVYFSIIDLSTVKNLGDDFYPLLYTICRNRFEKAHSSDTVVQFTKLTKELNDIEKSIEKAKKTKLKPPSGDDLGKGLDE